MDQSPRHIFKRVKERSILEAKNSVDEWRKLFKNGEIDENGNKIKYSLKQAAQKVGVPKKTLEDYHQLLKKAESLIDLQEVGDKKMGFLRNFLKQTQQQQQCQSDIFSDEEIQVKQEQIDEEQNYEEMIVEGEIEQYNDDSVYYFNLEQQVQTVIIQQTPQLDKKFEIYSDLEDCETDDEFDSCDEE